MINKKDISVRWFSGTGAGGQHRNRTQNCCEITHIPTGFKATGQNSRSRQDNYNAALKSIEEKMEGQRKSMLDERLNERRQEAIAAGTVRTYNFVRNEVKDNRSGKVADLDKFLDAKIDLHSFSIKDI